MDEIEVWSLPGCREPLSAFSHLLGAFVFAVLAYRLVRQGRGDRARMLSLTVLVVSSIQVLLISGIYHLCWPGPTRHLMLQADVAGILVLIAGSLTPVHVILFQGVFRWAPIALAWTVAVFTILFRALFFDATPGPTGIALFLAFGWGSVITAIAVWRKFGWDFVEPAVWAGLSYTLGAFVLVFHRPTLIAGVIGPHELWHVAVLSGMGFHWRFVSQFAAGMAPVRQSADDAEDSPITVPVPIPVESTQRRRSAA